MRYSLRTTTAGLKVTEHITVEAQSTIKLFCAQKSLPVVLSSLIEKGQRLLSIISVLSVVTHRCTWSRLFGVEVHDQLTVWIMVPVVHLTHNHRCHMANIVSLQAQDC